STRRPAISPSTTASEPAIPGGACATWMTSRVSPPSTVCSSPSASPCPPTTSPWSSARPERPGGCMADRFPPPERWRETDWEAKAGGQNPMSAIRTAEGLVHADPPAFSQELVDAFFARGRTLYQANLAPLLTGRAGLVLEYGCGAGRIM